MHAHHEVSLWSSGSCHSKEHYCLAETPDPPGGKKITSIFTIIVIFFASMRIITQYTFKFWRTHDGLQGSWNAYRQEHIVVWISRLTDSWKTSSTSCLMTLAGGGRMEALCWDSQASRMELRFTLRWARSSHMLRSRLFRWSLNWTGWENRKGEIVIITEMRDCYGADFKHYSFVSGAPHLILR